MEITVNYYGDLFIVFKRRGDDILMNDVKFDLADAEPDEDPFMSAASVLYRKVLADDPEAGDQAIFDFIIQSLQTGRSLKPSCSIRCGWLWIGHAKHRLPLTGAEAAEFDYMDLLSKHLSA